jgi:23S rRNA pseudouridine2605 synthase
VTGKPAVLGQRIEGTEKILIDGKPLAIDRGSGKREHVHVAYYKPAGELTSRKDPEGRRTVFDALPKPPHGRWIAIGRMAVSTSGLLVFTTDGELAHRLMHPRYEVSQQYAVRVLGSPDAAKLDQLATGVDPEEGARFDTLEPAGGDGANTWVRVKLHEPRHRDVRSSFEEQGLKVSRLIRVGYGPIELVKMRRGAHRTLAPTEAAALYAAAKLSRAAARR